MRTPFPACFLPHLLTAGAIAAEPAGLRDAIAEHGRAEAETQNRLYHVHVEPDEPSDYEFSYAPVDLDGDGVLDAIVFLQGDYCGSGGCTLEVFRGTDRGFEFVSKSTISRPPVRLLRESRFGWHSFTVVVSGGGEKTHGVVMRFDGRGYPDNPSMEASVTDEQLRESSAVKFTPPEGARRCHWTGMTRQQAEALVRATPQVAALSQQAGQPPDITGSDPEDSRKNWIFLFFRVVSGQTGSTNGDVPVVLAVNRVTGSVFDTHSSDQPIQDGGLSQMQTSLRQQNCIDARAMRQFDGITP